VDEHGTKLGSIENQEGLATIDCLNFLLDLGVPRVFGYSLGYDFSMMLRDLPDGALYMLVRPERRAHTLENGRTVHTPIYWRGFKLTFMRRRLGIQRVEWNEEKRKSVPVGRSVVVWDVFAFYQGKFTKALKDWKTTPEAIISEIAEMKDQRSNFDRMGPRQIQDYCDKECHLLALLVRQLIEAHEAADLPLESFYGAGSTASVLLTRMGVRDYREEPPAEMTDEVSRAFFGGRFELSRIGPVREPCWNHDISSAYPYELWRLPCLTHGRWKLRKGTPKEVDRAVRGARLALVHVAYKARSGPTSWGPFPFRFPRNIRVDPEHDILAGTIIFPQCSIGSWTWREEYLAAKDTLWPGITPIHAWCYETDCDCRPFAELPDIYRKRCAIGKDGPGIVLKLGPNSVYGKCAQSVGSAPFRSWVWAGNVTSGTRAQILRAIATAKDPRNVLMIATDGILACERLKLPQPEDTGTGPDVLRDEKGNVKNAPLGGWEIKEKPNGIFLAKAGVYWGLNADREEIAEVKARGISRAVLYDHAPHIEAHFAKHGWEGPPYTIDGRCLACGYMHELNGWKPTCPKCGAKVPPPCVRFIGVRQGITCGACKVCGKQRPRCPPSCGPDGGGTVTRSENFGEWKEWPLDISFEPTPKRSSARKDNTLNTWLYSPSGGMSAPYTKAHGGIEAARIKEYQEMIEEQPDCDLTLA
jgi:hypothetical protein